MLSILLTVFYSQALPPQPAGPDIDWDAFASIDISTALNTMLRIFLNTDFVGTEPKEASYPVTVLNSVGTGPDCNFLPKYYWQKILWISF